MKLTTGQVAAIIGVAPLTIRRWYDFYECLTLQERQELQEKSSMPMLPKYELAGSRGDRLWDEPDIELIKQFKEWVPHTRRGIFKKYEKEII